MRRGTAAIGTKKGSFEEVDSVIKFMGGGATCGSIEAMMGRFGNGPLWAGPVLQQEWAWLVSNRSFSCTVFAFWAQRIVCHRPPMVLPTFALGGLRFIRLRAFHCTFNNLFWSSGLC